jgi:hypothetical protein
MPPLRSAKVALKPSCEADRQRCARVTTTIRSSELCSSTAEHYAIVSSRPLCALVTTSHAFFLTRIDLVHIFFAKVGTLGANITNIKKPARSGSTKTWTTQLLLIELALLR